MALELLILLLFPRLKQKILKFLTVFILILINLLICFAVLTAILANILLFHPHQDLSAYNRLKTNPKMQEVTIKYKNSTYSGWFVKNAPDSSPLIIYFGGNGGCASNSCAYLNKLWPFLNNYNFLTIDYPTYGQSTGPLNEKTYLQTALSAYNYAISRPDADASQIIIIGYSIGTCGAAYLASQKPVRGLILIAPYDNALSLYNSALNIFRGPLSLLPSYRLDSISYAKKVSVKPLIITSASDELIDHKLSENLSKYFPKSPDFHLLTGLSHSDYNADPQVQTLMSAYIKESLSQNIP